MVFQKLNKQTVKVITPKKLLKFLPAKGLTFLTFSSVLGVVLTFSGDSFFLGELFFAFSGVEGLSSGSDFTFCSSTSEDSLIAARKKAIENCLTFISF